MYRSRRWDRPERRVEAQLARAGEVFCEAMRLTLDDDARRRLDALIRDAASAIVAAHDFESDDVMRSTEIALFRALYGASYEAPEGRPDDFPRREMLPAPTWPDTLYPTARPGG
jgi:hypothetical protein